MSLPHEGCRFCYDTLDAADEKSDEGRQTLGHKPGSASPHIELGREPGVDIFGLTYTTLLRPSRGIVHKSGLCSQVLAVVRA